MRNDLISRKALMAFIREQGEQQGGAYDWTLMLEDLAEFPSEEPRLVRPGDFVENPDMDQDGQLPVWLEYSAEGRDEISRKLDIPAGELNDGWDTAGLEQLADDGICRAWTGKPAEELRARTPWTDERMSFAQLVTLRDKALTTLSAWDIQAYFQEADIPLPEDSLELFVLLHRARLAWPECPPKLRAESVAWLQEREELP